MKAAVWARVSGHGQETENQLRQLHEWAARRGLEVVRVYVVEESAWKGRQRGQLEQVLADARRGDFQALLCWALDRLSREGPLAALMLVDRLGRLGVQVLSLQEPWTEAPGELRELLVSIAAWVAKMESDRRSERVKAGLERARAAGKRLGRPPGSRDRRRRRRAGYLLRWERERDGKQTSPRPRRPSEPGEGSTEAG